MSGESSKTEKIYEIIMFIFGFSTIWLPFVYLILTIFQYDTEIIKWISTGILLILTLYSVYSLLNLHDVRLKELREKDTEYRNRVKKNRLKYKWENYITSLAQQNIDYPASVKYLMDKGYKTLSQKVFAYCVTIETLIVSNDEIVKTNLSFLLLFNLLMCASYASVFIFLHIISKKGDKFNFKDYVFIAYTLMINFIFPIIFLFFVCSLGNNKGQLVIGLYVIMLLLIIIIAVGLFLILKAVDKKKQTLK
jgi:hypothetical protein